MTYRVEVSPAAIRALKQVDRQDQPRITAAIQLLSNDPRPPAATPMKGSDNWRVRVGNYRILYTIRDDVMIVVVVTLGHRREVYR